MIGSPELVALLSEKFFDAEFRLEYPDFSVRVASVLSSTMDARMPGIVLALGGFAKGHSPDLRSAAVLVLGAVLVALSPEQKKKANVDYGLQCVLTSVTDEDAGVRKLAVSALGALASY